MDKVTTKPSAMRVARALEVHSLVVLSRVGLTVDLDVHPDDSVIVLLQLRQLLLHVLPEPVRDLAVTTGDHNFHLNLP